MAVGRSTDKSAVNKWKVALGAMKQITIKGFTTNIKADDCLAIGLFGGEGTGKTRLAATAPDPIGVIPLDRKCRRTMEKISKELGKVVVMPEKDFIRTGNPTELAMLKPTCGSSTVKVDVHAPVPKCCAIHYYRHHVNTIKDAAYKLYQHPDIRTLFIDTGTQLWEDMLFAEYGRSQRIMPRDRGPVNQEMIDFLNSLSGKNLIVSHKAREVWKNDKPTGRFEHAGFPHLGYHVNVLAEMVNDPNKQAGDDGRFWMNVTMCQDNPDIQGVNGRKLLEDDMITFQYLALQIFPDSNPEDWE